MKTLQDIQREYRVGTAEAMKLQEEFETAEMLYQLVTNYLSFEGKQWLENEVEKACQRYEKIHPIPVSVPNSVKVQ